MRNSTTSTACRFCLILSLTAAAFVWSAPASRAQCLWSKAQVDMGFGKGFSTYAEAEYRTHNRFSPSARWAGAIGFEYRPVKYVKTTIGYSYIHDQFLDDVDMEGLTVARRWQPRHRIFAALTGSYSWKGLNVSLRERYQYTYNMPVEGFGPKGKDVLRSRLQLEYRIGGTGLAPYLSGELYNVLDRSFKTDKYRLSAGLGYSFCRQHRFKLYYLFENFSKAGKPDNHVIGIEYRLKLDLRKK